MTMLRYDYFVITCNGRLDNLVHPECPAVTKGELSDGEALLTSAKSAGWTTKGKNDHLCPTCSAHLTPAEEKPVRQPRAAKTAEQIEQSFPGGGAV